ncbi:MAG: endonuclease/exonuclease/phosphatase family protein [Candidatus Syntrophosphaera sp.]|nr:endonuclease/exonuclease/phosphatase family protein [Candidatus Syntrophosphaera sp.]
MKKAFALLFACLSLALGFARSGALEVQNHGSLKAVTFNIWSGSDYIGFASFGEWESPAIREQRYQILLSELRGIDPQVIFLQEVNPVDKYSRRLARDLNMDQIHQVCVGGIKIFGLGIPKGFKEGNAILAKKGLKLEKIEDWKLAGSPGVFSDNFSFHVDDPVSALAGRIVWENKPLNLVCVHLSAYPDLTPALQDSLQALCGREGWSASDCGKVRDKWEKGVKQRAKEAKLLLKKIARLEPDVPLILAGDFNSQPASGVLEHILAKGKFIDSAAEVPEYATWDALRNSNTFHSQFGHDARGNPNSHWKKFTAFDSAQLRRLDYILLDKAFQPGDVLNNRPVLNQPVNGLYPSDHYGVLAELDLNAPLAKAPELFGRIPRSAKTKISGLPIAMYDTDTGFGYGAKGYLFNLFKANESYDLILFHSTEGERWYKFEFSLPDEELRQRRKYPLASTSRWIMTSG